MAIRNALNELVSTAKELVLRQPNAGTSLFSSVFNSAGGAPPARGTRELIASYRQSPWLRSVVSKIAGHVSAVPWVVLVESGAASRSAQAMFRSIKFADCADRRRMVKQLVSDGDLIEVLNHPLLDLLNRANATMSGIAARKLTQVYLDLKGESFWILERNAMGMPVEFWPIPPNWVMETPGLGDRENAGFKVSFNGSLLNVPLSDMVWMRDLDPANPFGRGAGVGESLGDEIQLDEYAAKHVQTFFYNRAKPDMLIGVDGAKPEEIAKAKQHYENQTRGWARAHRTFWHSGGISVKELNQKFTDMELVDLRTWERDAFVNTYGVPPEILGIVTNSNRATAKEAKQTMADEVVVPRLELQRGELQLQLVPQFGDGIFLDYISPSPTDEEFELDAMKATPYMATRGEWRERQGLLDRGDIDAVHIMPAGLIEVPVGQPLVDQSSEEATPAPKVDDPNLERGEEDKGLDVKSTASVVTKTPEATIQAMLEALQPSQLSIHMDPIMVEQIEAWGNGAMADLGLAPNFAMTNPLVQAHLAESATRVVGINDTTRDQIRKALQEGFGEGMSIAQLSVKLEDTMAGISRARAATIARTEVVRSSNFSTVEAYRQTGVVERKQWVPTFDDRLRDEHDPGIQLGLAEPIPLNAEFEIDGASALFPGDFGIPELDINCRCTVAGVVEDIESLDAGQLETIWKATVQQQASWEKQLAKAVRKGLKEQTRALLVRLGEVA